MATTKVTTDVIDMSAQQPSGVIGEIREDTDTKRTQVYTDQSGSSEWRNLKEAALVYPTFTASYIIVGGGGGAGFSATQGATSGAGGYKEYTSVTLNTILPINITVGAGGAGSTVASARGGTGGLTQFDTNTVAGGGGGGSSQDFSGQQNGGDGGSGGGGGGNSGTTTGGAASPAGQGNAGGAGQDDTLDDNSGGGGGAGGAGGAASSGAPGNGGAGITTAIFTVGSLNIERAGGGGGANGNSTPGGSATGGGGVGATANAGSGGAGAVNEGGGAGGSSNGNGANGGSGIILIRAPKASATFSAGVTVNGTGPTSAGQSVSGITDGSEYSYSITEANSDTITFS